jgi:hypothetical protein
VLGIIAAFRAARNGHSSANLAEECRSGGMPRPLAQVKVSRAKLARVEVARVEVARVGKLARVVEVARVGCRTAPTEVDGMNSLARQAVWEGMMAPW